MNSRLNRFEDDDTRLTANGISAPAHQKIVSGYGTLMEREQALRFATEETRSNLFGRNAGVINEILVQQYRNIDLIIRSLSRLCEVLPHSERFNFWPDEAFSPSHQPSGQANQTDKYALGSLVARHESLAASVQLVIERHLHSEAEKEVLSEVFRSHEAMAWILNALLRDVEPKNREELLPARDKGILATAIRWAFPSDKPERDTALGSGLTDPLL